jgi:hypothetical protein
LDPSTLIAPGATVTEEAKHLCLEEMAEGEDETRNISNKLVTFITTLCTLVAMFFALSGIEWISTSYLGLMIWQYQNHNPPQIAPQTFRLPHLRTEDVCPASAWLLQVLGAMS